LANQFGLPTPPSPPSFSPLHETLEKLKILHEIVLFYLAAHYSPLSALYAGFCSSLN
jgi:hypothetical protein